MTKGTIRAAAAAAVCAAALAAPALANHRWSTYHWNRPSGEVTVPVGDNVTSAWDSYLQVAVNGGGGKPGWNDSQYIQSPLVAGTTIAKNCKAVPGTIQVCNSRYGQTGWLGIASIWLSNGHISQGTTKLNDTYFVSGSYNQPKWRRMVTCQEVGHDYGLGHVNENFDDPNTGSCMDYSNAPGRNDGAGTNEYPNTHDFDELKTIYTDHADSAAATNFAQRSPGQAVPEGVAAGLGDGIPGDSPAAWGRAVHRDGAGRPDIFEQDLGNGNKKITHVFWAVGEGPKGLQHED